MPDDRAAWLLSFEMTVLRALLALPLFALPLAGCTVVTPSSSGDGGGDGAAGDGGVAKSGTASCGQTVTCLGACNDDPCQQACFDKASPAGQQLITALANCLNTNMCNDAACAKAKCTPELTACAQDVEAPPPDAGVPPTMGAPLPADLVGHWHRVTLQWGEDYTFNANGTYTGVFLYDNAGSCITIKSIATSLDGVAEAKGNTLTLTRLKGTQTTTDCSDNATMKPTSQSTSQYTWSVSPDKMTLTLTDGAGSSDYKKQ